MNDKYAIAGKRLFEPKNINYRLLRKQKSYLVFLEIHYRDTLGDIETADHLKGVIAFFDTIQDIAVDVIGESDQEVFDIE